jgi:molecular chaperone HtpG
VYVTDSVEGIVPEFLTLLHGVLDSPDIPLNVSRSYLQSDSNVKKISAHITKKVADRLEEIFKNDRPQFEEKWDSLRLFIQYGILTDDKFYDRAEKFVILKDVDGKYFTLEEYKTLIKGEQTDKDGTLIYLYTDNIEERYAYIQAAKDKGYNILLFDGQLDLHFAGKLEEKGGKSRFVRVDSDTLANLIRKQDNENAVSLTGDQRIALQEVFKSQLPAIEKADFHVTIEALGASAHPIVLTQSEYMRRMREMSAFQSGMSFYGELPDHYSVVLNADHPLIQKVLADTTAACTDRLSPILTDIHNQETHKTTLVEKKKGKKEEEIPAADKEDLEATEKKIEELSGQRNAALAEEAAGNPLIGELIDLALLSNGMLKGEALSRFIGRSLRMIG